MRWVGVFMQGPSAILNVASRAAVRSMIPASRLFAVLFVLVCASAALHAPFATAKAAGSGTPGLEQAQRSLLKSELARLKPRNKDATNIYVLGIAGWADQDVF